MHVHFHFLTVFNFALEKRLFGNQKKEWYNIKIAAKSQLLPHAHGNNRTWDEFFIKYLSSGTWFPHKGHLLCQYIKGCNLFSNTLCGGIYWSFDSSCQIFATKCIDWCPYCEKMTISFHFQDLEFRRFQNIQLIINW